MLLRINYLVRNVPIADWLSKSLAGTTLQKGEATVIAAMHPEGHGLIKNGQSLLAGLRNEANFEGPRKIKPTVLGLTLL